MLGKIDQRNIVKNLVRIVKDYKKKEKYSKKFVKRFCQKSAVFLHAFALLEAVNSPDFVLLWTRQTNIVNI